MRILIVTGIFPPDPGGPATYVPIIASGFVQHNHRVSVITLSDSQSQGDDHYPFLVSRIPRNRFPKLLRFCITLFRIITEGWKSDIIYVNGLAIESVLANFFLRKPMVQKIVGDKIWEHAKNSGWINDAFTTFQNGRYSLRIEILKWLRKTWVNQADYIIVTTNYFQKVVSDWLCKNDKIRIVGNAVIERNFSSKLIEIPLQTKWKVITVCRLVKWKAIDDLIHAISYLNRDVGLVIIGDGPERKNLEQVAEDLGVKDRVFFAGRVENELVQAYLQNCDVFAFPSLWESFAMVILEAMGARLPVIATDIGGPNEFIKNGENGLLVPPGDRLALSKAIDCLVGDYDLKRKFVTASQVTLNEFSVENMVEKTLDVLTEAVQ